MEQKEYKWPIEKPAMSAEDINHGLSEIFSLYPLTPESDETVRLDAQLLQDGMVKIEEIVRSCERMKRDNPDSGIWANNLALAKIYRDNLLRLGAEPVEEE